MRQDTKYYDKDLEKGNIYSSVDPRLQIPLVILHSSKSCDFFPKGKNLKTQQISIEEEIQMKIKYSHIETNSRHVSEFYSVKQGIKRYKKNYTVV